DEGPAVTDYLDDTPARAADPRPGRAAAARGRGALRFERQREPVGRLRRRRDRKRPARGAASRGGAQEVKVTARTLAEVRLLAGQLAAAADELGAAMTAALSPGW